MCEKVWKHLELEKRAERDWRVQIKVVKKGEKILSVSYEEQTEE